MSSIKEQIKSLFKSSIDYYCEFPAQKQVVFDVTVVVSLTQLNALAQIVGSKEIVLTPSLFPTPIEESNDSLAVISVCCEHVELGKPAIQPDTEFRGEYR